MGKKDREEERRQKEHDKNAKSDKEVADFRETLRKLAEQERRRKEEGK